ncbi:MAG TPA: serine/threonine-protein kinase, partial [Vicinamibacteria bacterium]|nr:serine/threonine-protein kinase [Vicinamibacteria bacterium]
MSLQPDSFIGPYKILDKLGRGTMGQVFRAVDTDGQAWAIKVMAAELADEPELVERFQREAMAAALLDHPNITRVHDFGEEERRLYMVMELLRGSDLKALIDRGQPMPLQEKLSIMVQVGAGMAYVHRRNIVHRDLKPANIHVQPDGQAKIMDFGLVRVGDSNMTRTGTLMGSPAYMAPEVLMGNRADARSDVFSLGAAFYELLAGRRAFAGKGIAEIMMNVLQREPAPLASHTSPLPPGLVFLV